MSSDKRIELQVSCKPSEYRLLSLQRVYVYTCYIAMRRENEREVGGVERGKKRERRDRRNYTWNKREAAAIQSDLWEEMEQCTRDASSVEC